MTPSGAFSALLEFYKTQKDILKDVVTEFDTVKQTPCLIMEVPQIVNIKNVNLSGSSIFVTYRFYTQIGSQELKHWNASGTIADIASLLRVRLLQAFSKQAMFQDFTNIVFTPMEMLGLEKADKTLMLVGRQGVEFTLEEDAELEGVLVTQLHNRFKDWENTQVIREEITYAEGYSGD